MGRRKLPTEPFETDISGLNADGTGAGRHGERLLRIHGALTGERVSARYLFGRSFKGQAETLEVLEAACNEAPLVLLGSDLASRIPSQQLDALLSGVDPAVVVVPDVRGQTPLPDMAHRLRKQLGVLE